MRPKRSPYAFMLTLRPGETHRAPCHDCTGHFIYELSAHYSLSITRVHDRQCPHFGRNVPAVRDCRTGRTV
jgi:hypothetical protein